MKYLTFVVKCYNTLRGMLGTTGSSNTLCVRPVNYSIKAVRSLACFPKPG